MPNSIPGVLLPGDLEYKHTLLYVPKPETVLEHQSRMFMLPLMGRALTDVDASEIAKSYNGQLSLNYLDPAFLDKQGLLGIVMPSIESQVTDEKKTVYNWEEINIDDTPHIIGTFTAPVTAPVAGALTVFTVASTAKLRPSLTLRHLQIGTMYRVNAVLSPTTFNAYVAENNFTIGSDIPGTDVQGNALGNVAVNDTYIILSPAQKVGGGAISDNFVRPTQRRNAIQTVAVELEKTGHAEAEDTEHNTINTTLAERRNQLQYYLLSKLDDSLWFGKYARGMYGTEEAYMSDGVLNNIGTTKAITAYSSGTVWTIDKIEEIVADAAKTSNINDLAFCINSNLAIATQRLGRTAGTVFVENVETTQFGVSVLSVRTHRGVAKFYQLPDSKTVQDSTNNILRILNLKYIKPVTRTGRNLKWEENLRKDGTIDAKYDVYRGDYSLAVCHRTAHREVTGITLS